jgi:hypothetical protein
MVKAVFARVGCGRLVAVRHWVHALKFEAVKLLPDFILEYALMHAAGDWNIKEREKITRCTLVRLETERRPRLFFWAISVIESIIWPIAIVSY